MTTHYGGWCTPKVCELGEVLELLDPQRSKCVKSLSSDFEGRLIVECTLPLDVETAVGLQILGDLAVADPGLELTILARLKEG